MGGFWVARRPGAWMAILMLVPVVISCNQLRVPVQEGERARLFTGYSPDTAQTDTLFSEWGESTGYLAGGPWQLEAGWLMPLTRSRLAWVPATGFSWNGTYQLPGPINHSGVVSDGTWYGGGMDDTRGFLVSVNLATGKENWKADHPVYLIPRIVMNETVYAMTDDALILSLNAASGDVKWKRAANRGDRWMALVPYSDSLVMALSYRGRLVVWSHDGELVNDWQFPIEIRQILLTEAGWLLLQDESGLVRDIRKVGSYWAATEVFRGDFFLAPLSRDGSDMSGLTATGKLIRFSREESGYVEVGEIPDGTNFRITVTPDAYWIAGFKAAVYRVDRLTGALTATIHLPSRPVSPVLVKQGRWVVQLKSSVWLHGGAW